MPKQTWQVKRLDIFRLTKYGRFGSRLTAREIAALVGVAIKTAHRWIKDPSGIPQYQRELIEIKALGIIPDSEFEGWCARDGQIHTPTGRSLYPDQIINVYLQHQRASHLERVVESGRKEIAKLKNELREIRMAKGMMVSANDEV